ncbi:MAG: exodeoxyribonuclease VII large subunit [Beijerinckiaceae bacterium]
MTDTDTNLPEISVSELSGAIKRTVEDAFGYVRVRGEVSGYRGPSASGHVYFGLKDASAKIDAVIWKGVFGRMRIRPEEGLEVIATGKVSTFPGSSKYQLIVDTLEPAGVGALLAQLEERRKRLAAEGLFDQARKRPLPYLPAVIGVVTSPTGAVIRDIIHRIADRYPLHVVVWPVRVQGETSPAEVAAAIRGFNALDGEGPVPQPDVLIVARGGGSLEDLWGFNDEAVVRAAADSGIPLVSAVGHETDTTLIDHAADLRAPTPTGAAEMIVPVRAELLATVGDLGVRQTGGLRRFVERRRTELRAAARALPQPEALLALPRQRLDVAAQRLPGGLRAGLDRRRIALSRLAQRLEAKSPRAQLAIRRERLDQLGQRLARAVRNGLDRKADRLQNTAKLLKGYSFEGVLARGFALVRDSDGKPIRHVAQAAPGAVLTVRVSDGEFDATVGKGSAPMPKRAAKASTDRAPDLFS